MPQMASDYLRETVGEALVLLRGERASTSPLVWPWLAMTVGMAMVFGDHVASSLYFQKSDADENGTRRIRAERRSKSK